MQQYFQSKRIVLASLVAVVAHIGMVTVTLV